MKTAALIAFCIFSPVYALACDAFVELQNGQVQEKLAQLKDDTVDDFTKVLVYEDLACAERATVRSMAAQTALAAGPEALKAAVLTETLFDRDILILTPYNTPDLSEEARAAAQELPAITFRFVSKHRGQSCIGLQDATCHTTYLLDIRSTGVSLTYSGATAELSLNDASELEGFYVPKNSTLRIPVRAKLF
ncbi:MAG: hypothetical protein AAF762_11195 [Pseudomonadota bacterium]